MHINKNAAATDALDGQITALDREMFRLRDQSAQMHEARLIESLRALLPDGGILHTQTWTEDDGRGGDTGVTIAKVTGTDGTVLAAPDDDLTESLGDGGYEALIDDLSAIHYARPSRWSDGLADFRF